MLRMTQLAYHCTVECQSLMDIIILMCKAIMLGFMSFVLLNCELYLQLT